MTDLLKLKGKELDKELDRFAAEAKKTQIVVKPWTKEEEYILKRLHNAGVNCANIAKALNRPRNSVKGKLQQYSGDKEL